MAINTGDFWTLSDSIEDIEADQPYGAISLIEYGQSALDTSTLDESIDLRFGYGRGIPIPAACSEIATDIRQHKVNNNKMGELLTTEDIVQLNMHDADKVDTVAETTVMLRSAGIFKYDDTKFSNYRRVNNNKILSKPIVNGRGFPILLDDSYHKFQIKPKVKVIDLDNTNGSMEDGTMLSNNNFLIGDTQNGESTSN